MEETEMEVRGELMFLEWVRLDKLISMRDNHKLHDTGAICASIRKYGFKDPVKWEGKLNGSGALVEGNGRLEALLLMLRAGEPIPNGLRLAPDGMWEVPVIKGVEALSEADARAYSFDHNILTLGSHVKKLSQILKMFDSGAEDELVLLAESGNHPQTISVSDLEAMRLLRKAQAEYEALAGEPEISGVGELSRRVVLIFEAKEEADAAFERLGIPFTEGQVLYRWEEYHG